MCHVSLDNVAFVICTAMSFVCVKYYQIIDVADMLPVED